MTMQGTRTTNLLWQRGQQLADLLKKSGIKADEAAGESQLFWKLACSAAGVPSIQEVHQRALEALRDRERHPDPFAGFPR